MKKITVEPGITRKEGRRAAGSMYEHLLLEETPGEG